MIESYFAIIFFGRMYFVEHWLLATAVPAPAGVGGMTTVVSWKGGGHPLWEGGGHLSTGKQTGAARPRLEVFEDGRWTLLPGLQSTIRALRTPSPMPPGLPSPKIIYWSTTWKAEHFKKSKTKTVNIKQIFLIGSSFGTLLYLYILTIHSFFHPCIYVIQMINLSNVPSSRLWKPPWNSRLRHIPWNQCALILQKATIVV